MYPKPKPKVKKKSYLKPISDKRKERLKWYSEADLFRDKLIKKNYCWLLNCEICWNQFTIESRINQPMIFAHILAKGQYPHLRLFENNIAIVCSDKCHQTVDKYVAWNKREIEQKILNWENIKILDYKK